MALNTGQDTGQNTARANPRRRIFITGSAGFVGAATVRAALAGGHQVIALIRGEDGAGRLEGLRGDITIHDADLSNNDAIAAVLAETRPEIVIHAAWEGVGGPLRAGDIQLENIRTTVALADAAIAAGARKFVGIGSQAEYGRFDRRITEADLPEPTMLYGAAKLSACHLVRQRCREARMGFAWLRLFSVYGPGDNPNWLIPSAATSLVAGRAPKCTPGTQKWDYLHIDDVASGTLAAAVTDTATGVFNLSSGTPVAVRSIIERLRDLAAPGLALRFGDIPFGPDQIMNLEGDNSRLKQATGWEPQVDVLDGLAGVIDTLKLAA
jgi:nucleoside-diphosphate-sugar epimerase